nr:MAG TPA: hypothetical protein [Bacteriophage sp.]
MCWELNPVHIGIIKSPGRIRGFWLYLFFTPFLSTFL